MQAVPATSDAIISRVQVRYFSANILPSEDFYRVEPVGRSEKQVQTPLQIEPRGSDEL